MCARAPWARGSGSWAWLDLRAEPWVVSVPAVDRYHLLPVHNLDSVNAGYIGTRHTGSGAGHHLAGDPDRQEPTEDGAVVRGGGRACGTPVVWQANVAAGRCARSGSTSHESRPSCGGCR
nr:DUF1254 domain-containing protein [Streptomyces sp. NBC_00830]